MINLIIPTTKRSRLKKRIIPRVARTPRTNIKRTFDTVCYRLDRKSLNIATSIRRFACTRNDDDDDNDDDNDDDDDGEDEDDEE